MSHAEAEYRRPPGPDEPVTIDVDEATLTALLDLQSVYGNVVSIPTPKGRQGYFVNDPDMIRGILVRNHGKYVKGPGFERVKLLLGNGLFVSDGATWRRSRTMVAPGFTRQSLHRLIDIIVERCEDRCRSWEAVADAGDVLNITKEMTDFALELILKAIFGRDYERRIIADGSNPFAFLSEDASRDLKLVVKLRAMRELVLDVIAERREAGSSDDFDFLGLYLEAEDREGQKYNDRELLDEVMTLIVAGFETTAGTLNWAWYLISQHADVGERLFAEAKATVPDPTAISPETIGQLTFLRQVLDETMRLYPPGWIFSRRAIEDDASADFDIPAGTDVYISPYILHRTKDFWPEAEKFDPDRFAAEEAMDKKKQRAYVPFSLGPRRCIGEYLSILEMTIHIGMLVQRFQLTPVSDVAPEIDFAVNLRSRQDILMSVRRR